MKKRKISLPLFLGICLILCSLCLMLALQLRMHIGSRKCQQAVSKLSAFLPDRTPGISGIYPGSNMPVLEIDGVDYVAMLEIPAFGVTLPVADKWEEKNLYAFPSRFWGSAYDRTLIIGGADYPLQFAFCDRIAHGELVKITDMTGAQYFYTVSRIDRAKRAETQWLQGAEWDLTLFCRDMYSMEYIAVRCVSALK